MSTKSNNRLSREKLRQMVLLAMLFALALVLSWFESLLPPIPAPVPLKLGLSNIAVMYALFFLNAPSAYLLAVLKAAYAMIMRGVLAGSLSLGGGLLSVTIMLLLHRLSGKRASIVLLSVSGAIGHNLGQFLVLLINFNLRSIIGVLPILLVSGVAGGILSAVLLRVLLPALGRVSHLNGIVAQEQARALKNDRPAMDAGEQGSDALPEESAQSVSASSVQSDKSRIP